MVLIKILLGLFLDILEVQAHHLGHMYRDLSLNRRD